MRFLFAVLAFSFCYAAWSAEGNIAPAAVRGEVLEATSVDSYTYLRIKTADGEVWAAVGKAALKKGEKVVIENVMTMNNFESKALKRSFQKIYFGTLGSTGAGTAVGKASGHSGMPKATYAGDVKVPKAGGADGRTVAEVFLNRAALKDKTVAVRGRVVKYSPAIMGKNWIHLRDGSGAEADGSNDLLLTSADQASVGDVVVARGVVRVDKDFGAGYAYKVLVEEAVLTK